MEILSDIERLQEWNDILEELNIQNNVDSMAWIKDSVYITPFGSIVNQSLKEQTISDLTTLDNLTKDKSIDEINELMIKVLLGVLKFPNSQLEERFWKVVQDFMLDKYKYRFEASFIPARFRKNILENSENTPS